MAAKPHRRESCPQRSASPTSYRPILEADRCGQLSRGSRRFAALRHQIPPTVLAEEAKFLMEVFHTHLLTHQPMGLTHSQIFSGQIQIARRILLFVCHLKYNFSANTNRRSTTREIAWYRTGFDAASFALTNQRALRIPEPSQVKSR